MYSVATINITVRSVLLAVSLPVVSYYILSRILRRSPKNLPPGPRAWGTNWKLLKAALNGTLPLLAAEWAKIYGRITFVYLLGQPIVFLNDTDTARKLIGSDRYKLLVADRAPNAAFRIVNLCNKDMLFSRFDNIMKKKRRLFFSVIGLYGDGVERFENVVWEELQRLFAELDETEGEDIDLAYSLTRSLKIIIYILTIGQRPEDPNIPDILEEYDMALNELSRPEVDYVLDYLPFMAKIPGRIKKAVDRTLEAKKKADELVFYGPKRTYIPGQPRGITDLLLEHQTKPGYEWMAEDEDEVIGFLTTLFLAANLTTRSTLTGIFLCLLNDPEVSKKIQHEVDTVLGDQRPRIEHRSSMPYIEASIIEILRVMTPTPLSGFRRNAQELDFEGMTLPKDTMIFMVNWYFHHNESLWKNPWDFKPERFLDGEGKLLPAEHPTRKKVLPFGIGARACPGETFARSRVFLFIASIFQRYQVLPPAKEKLTPADFKTYDPKVQGLVRQAPPFKCRLKIRETFRK